MNTLKLVRRGLSYSGSDIGSYRVTTSSEVRGKDGRLYSFEFWRADKWRIRTTKLNGGPLKRPVREVVAHNVLATNNQYQADDVARHNLPLSEKLWEMNLPYNVAGILEAVNYISADHYDAIEFA